MGGKPAFSPSQLPPGLGMSTRELVEIALIAALIVLTKTITRVPLGIPGHSSVLWMAFLVMAKALVPRPISGTVTGVVSGLLALAIWPGTLGLLAWVKYLVPGMVLDVVTPLVGGRLDKTAPAVVVATLASLGKLSAGATVAIMLGLPAGVIAFGLGASSITHAVFGAMGGLLAALVLKRLIRADIPELRGRIAKGGAGP